MHRLKALLVRGFFKLWKGSFLYTHWKNGTGSSILRWFMSRNMKEIFLVPALSVLVLIMLLEGGVGRISGIFRSLPKSEGKEDDSLGAGYVDGQEQERLEILRQKEMGPKKA